MKKNEKHKGMSADELGAFLRDWQLSDADELALQEHDERLMNPPEIEAWPALRSLVLIQGGLS